jgi:hypothetical protein
VDNTGTEIVTDYQGDPSYSTAKTATLRDHRWTATWEIPAWIPAGTYRVRIVGQSVATVGVTAQPYDLTTPPFAVTANQNLSTLQSCDADGDGTSDTSADYFSVTSDATGLHVRMAAFLPQGQPIWEQRYSRGGDQIGNYRLWTERGTSQFPLATPLHGTLQVLRDSSPVGTITLLARDIGGHTKLAPYCPPAPELPVSEGSFAWSGAGVYTIRYQTGDVTDAYGNTLPAAASANFTH